MNIKVTLGMLSLISASVFFTSCDSTKEPETAVEEVAPEPAPEPEPVSARPVEWAYTGDSDPTKWGGLSPAYVLCGEGKSQSPIDLIESDAVGGAKWEIKYGQSALHIAHNEHMEDIIDNGHTIQVTVDDGSVFTFNGIDYALKQFHFHTPSEHMVNGQHAPMEMHMVHQSADGGLAVVSVLFKEGKKDNEVFAPIIANLPNAKGEDLHPENVVLDLGKHMPKNNVAYHYVGSLTTPPCSQDVQWLVLGEPITLSKAQIAAVSSRIGPNNRPVQDLNDRKLEKQTLVEATKK